MNFINVCYKDKEEAANIVVAYLSIRNFGNGCIEPTEDGRYRVKIPYQDAPDGNEKLTLLRSIGYEHAYFLNAKKEE